MALFIIYLIKVNIALFVLYLFYKLSFSKDTFLGLRRFILILTYITAFTYPFLSIPNWLIRNEAIGAINHLYGGLLPEIIINNKNPAAASVYSWLWVTLIGIYLVGVVVLLIRTILEISKTCVILHRSEKMLIEGIQVCMAKEKQEPYSFFRWICFSPELHTDKEMKEILIHERAHVHELHSVDILLAQFVIILCWFNPFVWLLRSELRINHEYLADRKVVISGFDKKIYQYHLLGMKHTQLAAANLYNNFSVLPLKNRIKMLNKKRTRNIMKSKYLMFLPVAALLVFFSNCTSNQPTEPVDTSSKLEEKLDVKAQPIAVDDETPNATTGDILNVAEVMPEFPGGTNALLSYLNQNIKYPPKAIEQNTQGRVIVQFVVNKEGEITDVGVIRGVNPDLDKEAIRVISAMPKWKPGKEKGEPVRVKYTIPVMFKLQ